MNEQRRSGHALTRFTAHLVWVTKYRYPVLKGDVQGRCRSLIIQICDVEDVQILKGVVSKDHVHMHIEYQQISVKYENCTNTHHLYRHHQKTDSNALYGLRFVLVEH